MVIYLHGDDSYRSLQRLKTLKEGFIKKFDKSSLNVVILDKDKLEFADWQKAVAASGFLAQKRLIVIKNLITNKKNKEVCQEIADYLTPQNLKGDNIIIFWEGKQIKSSVLGNKLKKVADKTELFNLLENTQLNKWINKEVAQLKGKIDSEAVRQLVEKVGDNLWQMSNELNKLVSYKNGKEIKAKDVELFVRSKYDQDIFHLTDALGAKNAKLASKLIGDQLNSGNHPLALLATLSWQFRNLILIKSKLDQGVPSFDIASDLKIHPYVVKKSVAMLQKFELAELKKAYQGLLEIDLKLKTSRVDPKTLLNLFVIKIAS